MVNSSKKTKLQSALEQHHNVWRQPVVGQEKQPQVLSNCWDLALGYHPALPTEKLLSRINPCEVNVVELQHYQTLELPLSRNTNGHHCVLDQDAVTALLGPELRPIAPVFVKDLAGRIIHTGLHSLPKRKTAWQHGRTVDFPAGAMDVTDQVANAEQLENIFMVAWRTLDAALEPDDYQLTYPNPHFYPYKLRLDTFYQDGWRIPQTESLFVREAIDPNVTAELSADVIQRWEKRPAGQSYEAFYEANDGDRWFEELFLQGCTIIPTFEAANGFHQVGKDFTLQDYWPGRAVSILHEVIGEEASAAPAGTILQVETPGFLTGQTLQRAKVIVSDGSGYKSPHQKDDAPLYIDAKLPHPRASAQSGECWVPTAPSHFEVPALWGWSENGHFQQQSGPVWDPLHYFYASYKIIRRSLRQAEDSGEVATVPAEMKTRFYPVVPFTGFDTFSYILRQDRQNRGSSINSGVDHQHTALISAGIGYHPLPPVYEYELDTWLFPELAPVQSGKESAAVESYSFVPIIQSQLTAGDFIKSLVVADEIDWVSDVTTLATSSDDPMNSYPYLTPGNTRINEREIIRYVSTYLVPLNKIIYDFRPQELLRGRAIEEIFTNLKDVTSKAVNAYILAARNRRHERYTVNRDAIGWYALARWQNLPRNELIKILANNMTESKG